MKEINHECYVSLEVAKLLKEAGFDWECRGYFDGTEFHPNGSVECTNYNSDTCKYLKVPTIDIAQRWLREIKLVSVESRVVRWFNRNQTHECTIFWSYIIFSIDTSSQEAFDRIIDADNGFEFNTYEQAQEAGIKKALELILEKGE